MCGIVGIAYRDPQRPVDSRLLQRMCAAIRHRGPDDEGYFLSGPAGLAMRRLSIIDLAGGRQPVFNEDRSCAIVFNGEIYNYRQLGDGLRARGHGVRSSGDTETIVHLYEERGVECARALRGMFAFAIWDSGDRSLFLARDRFGIKPLYYVAAPWGLAFASELRALVAAELTTAELDWDSLDAYLQLGYIPAPRSPFCDVRKLEPGHWLRWRDGEIVVQPYWDFPQEEQPAPRDLEREVLGWIDDAVAAHLVSDVPVAAFLSGGLDSSAVVASAMLAGSNPPLHVFTGRYLGSDATAADETALARSLATRYGAELTVVDINPGVGGIMEPIVQALDEPLADASAIPTWALSAAVGGSYKVALTGIGGDELFAGYRRHVGLLAVERYRRLPQPLRSIATRVGDMLPDSLGPNLVVDRVKRFLRAGSAATGTPADRFMDMVTRADDDMRARLYHPLLQAHVTRNAARERFRSHYTNGGEPRGLSAGLYLDYKMFLADDVLALSDRLSMAHSLEIRVPLVDHVLVEQVFPLPGRLKAGRFEMKRLMRRAVASRLPAEHLRAPKRGFIGPVAAWLRHELRPLLEDELSAQRIARLGYWNPREVTRLLDEHVSQRHNRDGILWALLCFSIWHRQVMEDRAPRAAAAPAARERVAAAVTTPT